MRMSNQSDNRKLKFYTEEEEIVEGGQGNVEIITNSISGEVYACKHLLDPRDSEAVDRFLKEIKIIRKMDHPNVIKVLDSGSDLRGPYYCMPKYSNNLSDYLEEGLFQDFSKQFRILAQIIAGVKALHDKGIIHRDLKPANILLNNYNDVVICDFGFSKDMTSDSTSLTITGDAFGTEGYISPEQRIDSKNVDYRTDIFALGVILRDITGLNQSYNTEDVIKRVATKAVSPNRDDRYKDIIEFGEAVKAAYDYLFQKKDAMEIDTIITNIATGSYSDEVIIEYIKRVIDSKNYTHGWACDLLTGLSEKQYLYVENNDFDLCMDLHWQVWEDYQNTWAGKYLEVDEMADTAKSLISISKSSKIKGFILARLSTFAYTGNSYAVMKYLADSLLKISVDSEFRNAFLLYANKSQVKSNYKRIGRVCPTWI